MCVHGGVEKVGNSAGVQSLGHGHVMPTPPAYFRDFCTCFTCCELQILLSCLCPAHAPRCLIITQPSLSSPCTLLPSSRLLVTQTTPLSQPFTTWSHCRLCPDRIIISCFHRHASLSCSCPYIYTTLLPFAGGRGRRHPAAMPSCQRVHARGRRSRACGGHPQRACMGRQVAQAAAACGGVWCGRRHRQLAA